MSGAPVLALLGPSVQDTVSSRLHKMETYAPQDSSLTPEMTSPTPGISMTSPTPGISIVRAFVYRNLCKCLPAGLQHPGMHCSVCRMKLKGESRKVCACRVRSYCVRPILAWLPPRKYLTHLAFDQGAKCQATDYDMHRPFCTVELEPHSVAARAFGHRFSGELLAHAYTGLKCSEIWVGLSGCEAVRSKALDTVLAVYLSTEHHAADADGTIPWYRLAFDHSELIPFTDLDRYGRDRTSSLKANMTARATTPLRCPLVVALFIRNASGTVIAVNNMVLTLNLPSEGFMARRAHPFNESEDVFRTAVNVKKAAKLAKLAKLRSTSWRVR